jgi:hypothetical protein
MTNARAFKPSTCPKTIGNLTIRCSLRKCLALLGNFGEPPEYRNYPFR